MKDASFDQRGQKTQGTKGKQHGLSFLKLLAEVNIGVAAGAAVMLFLVAVVSSATLIVHQELSQSGGESILGKAQAKSKVLGYSYGYSYSYQDPICSNNVCMSYRLFAGDKFSADISFGIQNGNDNALRGSIKVNGKKFAYNIRESHTMSTGYSLEPGKTYNFVFYKGLQGTGKVLNKLVIAIPQTQRYTCEQAARPDGCYYSILNNGACGTLICPKPPTYGYQNPTPPTVCQTLWYKDSNNQVCQQKQFCGNYYYSGLETFGSQNDCNGESRVRIGAVINKNGTVFLVTEKGLLGFASVEAFSSWGYSFGNVMTANKAEEIYSQINGVIQVKDPACKYPEEQAAGTCGRVVPPVVTPTTTPPVIQPTVITIPTNMTEFVGNLYQCVLGRTASASEKEYWAGTFTTQKTSVVDMYQNFFGGAEYTSKNKTDAEYTKQVYSCVLFRDASQTEINSQSANIASLTRKGLLSNFVNSTEFQNLKNQKLQYLTVAPVAVPAGKVTASLVSNQAFYAEVKPEAYGTYLVFSLNALGEDVKVKSITIRIYGNFNKSSSGTGVINNITLKDYNTGILIGSVGKISNCDNVSCYITFSNFNNSYYLISKDTIKTFNVGAYAGTADLVRSGEQFRMGLNAGTDIGLIGAQSEKAIIADGGELNANGALATIISNVIPVGITVPTTMSEFVGSMYQCVLGRTASASEKESWASTFTTQKTPIMTMYKTFLGSAEYTLKNTSNSDYAKQVYTCVLFRTPAQSEIDFQANAIPSITRDGLLSNFLNSGEFGNLKSQKMQFLSGFATK